MYGCDRSDDRRRAALLGKEVIAGDYRRNGNGAEPRGDTMDREEVRGLDRE